jgi:hypothetical protein
VTFTATPANGGTAPTYQWKLNGSNVGTNSNVFTTSTLVNGDIITVVMTSNATPCLTGSPATSGSITTIVNPNTLITTQPSAFIACEGASSAALVVSATGTGNITYQWYSNTINSIIGGTLLTSANNASYIPILSAAGTLYYYVIATSNCSGAISSIVSVKVNPKPIITISKLDASGIANNDGIICDGSSVTLSGTGATSYLWSGGITNGVAFTPSTSGIYTVTGTDVNGCVNTAIQTITVNALPTISINNPSAVCSPSTIDLTLASITAGSTSNLVFTYFKDALATILLPNSNTTALSGTYYIKGVDINACSSIKPVNVIINPLPNILINASKTSICLGDSLTLKGFGAVTYIWDNNITDGKYFTPKSTISYNVIGTDANGCKNGNSIIVKVNTLPIAEYVTSSSSKVMVLGNITLTAYASLGKPPYTYYWNTDPSKASIFGNSNPATLTGAGVGDAAVSFYVTDANGCKSGLSEILMIRVNPTEMLFEVPNAFMPYADYPDNRFLKASYNFAVKNVNYFRVYNRMGQLVYELINQPPGNIKWDGRVNGILQESDGYVWIADITGIGAVTSEHRSGQFLLLK